MPFAYPLNKPNSMKPIHLILVLTTSVILFSCKTSRDRRNSGGETSQLPKAELMENPESVENHTPVSILAVRLAANTLELDVEYSGGCEEHSFRLIGSTAIQKSLPPKRGILLYHNNNGDSCRGIENKTVKFDITPLAYESGEIILVLEGWKDPISYTAVK